MNGILPCQLEKVDDEETIKGLNICHLRLLYTVGRYQNEFEKSEDE